MEGLGARGLKGARQVLGFRPVEPPPGPGWNSWRGWESASRSAAGESI